MPVRYVSADEPSLRGTEWIGQQWEAARLSIADANGAVLVLDEIQKTPPGRKQSSACGTRIPAQSGD
jgi:hypothetical protein